jgi:hypothetical protein
MLKTRAARREATFADGTKAIRLAFVPKNILPIVCSAHHAHTLAQNPCCHPFLHPMHGIEDIYLSSRSDVEDVC